MPGHVPCQLTLTHQPFEARQVGPPPSWGFYRHQLALALYALPVFTPLPPQGVPAMEPTVTYWTKNTALDKVGTNMERVAGWTGFDGCRVVSLAPVPFLPYMKPTTAHWKYPLNSHNISQKSNQKYIYGMSYIFEIETHWLRCSCYLSWSKLVSLSAL